MADFKQKQQSKDEQDYYKQVQRQNLKTTDTLYIDDLAKDAMDTILMSELESKQLSEIDLKMVADKAYALANQMIKARHAVRL